MTHHLDLTTITLAKGHHAAGDQGCVMDWVSVWSGERTARRKTDKPKCTAKPIAAFAIAWNDALDDATRQRLVSLIPELTGTAGPPALDERLAWMATDWLVRTFTPSWLDLAGLGEHAAALRGLPELETDELAVAAMGVIDAARTAARSVARSAAESAAESAAWSAAESAAWSAARSAAWSAAWNAAESAAESAAWSAARTAARSAARTAAESAAWSAARTAAWSAARSALAPTVAVLQDEAYALLLRMCRVAHEWTPAAAPEVPS